MYPKTSVWNMTWVSCIKTLNGEAKWHPQIKLIEFKKLYAKMK